MDNMIISATESDVFAIKEFLKILLDNTDTNGLIMVSQDDLKKLNEIADNWKC